MRAWPACSGGCCGGTPSRLTRCTPQVAAAGLLCCKTEQHSPGPFTARHTSAHLLPLVADSPSRTTLPRRGDTGCKRCCFSGDGK